MENFNAIMENPRECPRCTKKVGTMVFAVKADEWVCHDCLKSGEEYNGIDSIVGSISGFKGKGW